jgi:sugar lactone lactonase YvrE
MKNRTLGWIVAALGVLTPVSQVVAAPAPIALPGDRVFPESITSTRDGTLYVGSLASGGVYRVRASNTHPQLWIKPGTFGSNAVFGVLADERSNTLWLCSNDMSPLGVVIDGGDKGSVLKGFDLTTGKGKISAVMPGEHTLCNDIAIGPDGSAFVTNTQAPQIFRLPPGGNALELWMTDASLQPAPGKAGLDGIAFGSDGNLYVDTYTPGDLYRIDVKDGKPGKLKKLQPSRLLVLADAIRPFAKDSFLIVEGGGRLDRILIHGDNATVKTLRDGMATPTGVAIAGATAWVSEGQLSYLFDASKKQQKPNLPFRLYPVVLPSR